jgi:putative redox protein
MSVETTRKVGQYAFEIQADGHRVLTDIPEKKGGNDVAPDPHAYLEIALAGCTAITLIMVAQRRNIPLVDVKVTIHITAEGDKNSMTRDIQLIGELSEDHKQQLLAAAEKCPIHQFLEKGATVTSQLID